MHTDSSRDVELRLTSYRLELAEKLPDGPRKQALLGAIRQRLASLEDEIYSFSSYTVTN